MKRARGASSASPFPCSAYLTAQAVGLENRLRAINAAAAAPNSRTIGGAGTGAGDPPFDPVPPLLPLEPCQPPFELQPPLLLQPLLLDP